MASLKHWLEFLAMRSGKAVVRNLSDSQADRFGAWLGRRGYAIAGKRREIARENLRQAFGESWTPRETERCTREVFENVGRLIIECARLSQTPLDKVRSAIHVPDPSFLARLSGEGHGAIFVTAHFGNWELLPVIATAAGFQLEVVATEQRNRLTNDLINAMRTRFGSRVIPTGIAVKEVLRALRANRFVALVADQHAPASGALVMPFFGRMAAVAKGPALFAVRSGSPIIPLLLRRVGPGKHELRMGPVVRPEKGQSEDEQVWAITRAYCDYFESEIRLTPSQWLWTHRRWKV